MFKKPLIVGHLPIHLWLGLRFLRDGAHVEGVHIPFNQHLNQVDRLVRGDGMNTNDCCFCRHLGTTPDWWYFLVPQLRFRLEASPRNSVSQALWPSKQSFGDTGPQTQFGNQATATSSSPAPR